MHETMRNQRIKEKKLVDNVGGLFLLEDHKSNDVRFYSGRISNQ